MVVGHKGVKLERVELKTGVVDVLHILHGVLVHGEQCCSLEDTQKSLHTSLSPHSVSLCSRSTLLQ